jgi:hypothetical protein
MDKNFTKKSVNNHKVSMKSILSEMGEGGGLSPPPSPISSHESFRNAMLLFFEINQLSKADSR